MYVLLDKLTTTYRNVLARGSTPYEPQGEQIQDEIDPSEWPDTNNTDDVARDESTETYFIKDKDILIAEYKRRILLKAQELAFYIVNNYRYKIDYYNARLDLGDTLTTGEQTELDDYRNALVVGVNFVRARAQEIENVTSETFEGAKALIDIEYNQIYQKYLNKLETIEIVINGMT